MYSKVFYDLENRANNYRNCYFFYKVINYLYAIKKVLKSGITE